MHHYSCTGYSCGDYSCEEKCGRKIVKQVVEPVNTPYFPSHLFVAPFYTPIVVYKTRLK